jgi:hypothetical protein
LSEPSKPTSEERVAAIPCPSCVCAVRVRPQATEAIIVDQRNAITGDSRAETGSAFSSTLFINVAIAHTDGIGVLYPDAE